MAAAATGGFFVFGTFHLWMLALVSLVVAMGVIVYWLWTGSAIIPEKDTKSVGLGLSLPLYQSGISSVSWWAMFITMLADLTAFVCLVFGYFFFWTRHSDFPPDPSPGPGLLWPVLAAVFVIASWALTLLARGANRRRSGALFHVALAGAAVLALAGAAALIAGPWLTDLNPAENVYPATVWLLAIWAAVHVVLGVVMHLYCVARRWFGYLTPRYDIDIANVALYWHFCLLTVAVTVAVVAGFPLVA
jgi:cytochrome c oxidase subunit I+III